jgi:hypothetical protein
MDLRAALLSTARMSGRQFAFFRLAFGAYLAVHFAQLIPVGTELFSSEGTLPRAALSPLHGLVPNVLAMWDSPGVVVGFLSALFLASLFFAAGIWRRIAALFLWYGWACLFNRNPLIANPSIPYVGLLLLLTTLVPPSEAWRLFGRKSSDGGFFVPLFVLLTAWALMAVGYSYSGVVKLAAPSWIDGTALWHVLNNPLARDGVLRDAVLRLPMSVFGFMTWSALALEVLFLPLTLWRRTRPVAWAAMAAMHVGIVGVVSFADLSLGMLMLHLFTFDHAWVRGAGVRWRPVAWARAGGPMARRA